LQHGTSEQQEIADEISKYRIDIAALQEIRWQGIGKINKKDYTFYYGGRAEKTGQAGTGFIILNRTMRNRILQFEMINKWISKIRRAGKLKNITILSVYTPTNDMDKAIRDDNLDRAFKLIPKYDLKVITGDFKAQI
jgi:exonuclease III